MTSSRTEERVATDPEVERAEAALAQSRARVTRSMTLLREEVRSRADWRARLLRHPKLALAAALALGFLWGRGRDATPTTNRRT
jgi:hypothetical protein